MPKVHFLDVTNRDGVQTARTGLSKFGKTMVNFYLARLGVAQSEIGFPFLFHEVPYVRANVALARAGAFGDLRLSGWCRAIAEDVERAAPLGLTHYNLSISTSDQMIAHKFRGKLDRSAILREATAAVAAAKAAGAQTIGVNAEDGSRTDDGFLLEFAIAARDAGADRVRYCDTIGGDSPGRIRERFAKLASAVGIPVETHCHNDLGMAVANSVSGALGDLDAGQDAWINTCVNGIGERSGNADLLSCILAFSHAFGVAGRAEIGDQLDLSWAPPVRAVGQLRLRPAAAAEPAGHRPERVRPRVRHPRRRRAEGPAELRAVRRRRRWARSRPTGSPRRAGWC